MDSSKVLRTLVDAADAMLAAAYHDGWDWDEETGKHTREYRRLRIAWRLAQRELTRTGTDN